MLSRTIFILLLFVSLTGSFALDARFKKNSVNTARYSHHTDRFSKPVAAIDFTSRRSTEGSSSAKIYGGIDVLPDALPFIAFIKVIQGGSSRNCSGIVISDSKILTNAHCFFKEGTDYISVEDVYVGVGITDGTLLEKSNSLSVLQVDIHDEFDWEEDTNDLAVIVLEHDLPSSQKIAAYTNDRLFPGDKAFIAGYGKSENSNGILKEATMKFINMRTCTRDVEIKQVNQKTKYCFVSAEVDSTSQASSTACSGDSGAPVFFINENGIMEVYSLNSYHVGDCGKRDTISVGIRLMHYRTRINHIIADNHEGWDEVYPQNDSEFYDA